jgi:hypothetical protein
LPLTMSLLYTPSPQRPELYTDEELREVGYTPAQAAPPSRARPRPRPRPRQTAPRGVAGPEAGPHVQLEEVRIPAEERARRGLQEALRLKQKPQALGRAAAAAAAAGRPACPALRSPGS